jgi:hypothetical protein
LLDRDLSRAGLGEALKVADPLLTEVVNYGVAALRRCMEELRKDEHTLGILLPLHLLLEMTDAVHVQLLAGAPGPARLQLRSAFEAVSAIEYMLKDDTKRRAFAYLAGWAHGEIAKCNALRKHTSLGFTLEQVDQRIGVLEAQLQHPGWKEASAELKALKKKGGKPHWYALYGGPPNLSALAEHLGELSRYDGLYRDWSGPTHGCDFNRQVITGRGTVAFRKLRDAEGFNFVVSFAVHFAVKGTREVLLHFRPGEEAAWGEWYDREVKGPYAQF